MERDSPDRYATVPMNGSKILHASSEHLEEHVETEGVPRGTVLTKI